MLRRRDEIRCGVFDSAVQRPNKKRSALRTVTDFEIELFRADGGTSFVNGVPYPVRRGMILCAKPGDRRRSDFPVRCSFLRLEPLAEADECERLAASFPSVAYCASADETDALFSLYAKLSSLLITPARPDPELEALRENALIFEILCGVARICRGEEEAGAKPVGRIVREAYDYVGEHFTERCSLAAVAAAVHVSPHYLHAVFSRQVGMTPLEYRNEKRIEKAKRLLAAGEASLPEIALETGFCTQSHFTKVFKAACGVTPAQYRKATLFSY